MNNTIQEILIDSAQNKHFYFTDYNLKKTYYAIADSSNAWKLQKKIDLAPLETNGNENRLNILTPNALSITTLSVSNAGSQIDYFNLLQKDTAYQCFGTDTSFLSFKPAQLYEGTWGTITVQPAIYTETIAPLSVSDYSVTKETICVKRHVCDVLKLNAPDTVCSLTQPIKISATKNIDCDGKVFFRFDTSAVTSYSQLNDTMLLLSFTNSWQGKVYATISSCPFLNDSIAVNVFAPESPLNLGKDTVLCKGETLQLSPSNKFKQYYWQDGSNGKSYTVSAPGQYYLTALDYCGKKYSDTINIQYSNAALNLGNDIEICLGQETQLSAPGGFNNYLWQPDYHINSIHINSPIVSPYKTTAYYIEAKDFYNCTVRDTILVKVDTCETQFFIPTAFTPNGDGRNDYFKPIIKGELVKYQFLIYNRWGQIIFSTNDSTKSWDGTVSNKLQATGVYVWICNYQFINEQPKQSKGTVLLIL